MFKGSHKREIAFAFTAILSAAALCYPFTGFIGYRSVALILLLVVSVLAMRMSLAAVLIAATLGALVWDFFFIPPHFTLTIGSGEDALLISMYFIVAVLNGIINHRSRQFIAEKRQKEDREKALKLYNTLFNSLSHELRNPLAALQGAADTLLNAEIRLNDRQRRELLSQIFNGAMQLGQQIDNLLNMSRIESSMIFPRKEWFDVHDLIHGAVRKLNLENNSKQVEVGVPPGFPLVRLDYVLMEQIMCNLINNALQHTPDGTSIHIDAKLTPTLRGSFYDRDNGEALNLSADKTTHMLVLDVWDDGNGFPEEEIAFVFDRFYRPEATKADGTGLGLFVVKGFTEAQGGEVSLMNRQEGGARFTLEFPTDIVMQNIHTT